MVLAAVSIADLQRRWAGCVGPEEGALQKLFCLAVEFQLDALLCIHCKGGSNDVLMVLGRMGAVHRCP